MFKTVCTQRYRGLDTRLVAFLWAAARTVRERRYATVIDLQIHAAAPLHAIFTKTTQM